MLASIQVLLNSSLRLSLASISLVSSSLLPVNGLDAVGLILARSDWSQLVGGTIYDHRQHARWWLLSAALRLQSAITTKL